MIMNLAQPLFVIAVLVGVPLSFWLERQWGKI